MHLLLFSDIHCNKEAIENLVTMSQKADIVIGAGDFASKRKGLQEVIEALSAIECPSVLVPGNSESHDELVYACRNWPSARVLHGSGTEIKGVNFWGVGGGIPTTPFGPKSYDFSEDEGRQLLNGCPAGAILVSHSPPKGVLDISPNGESLGSLAVLEVIKKCNPSLAVCGHIHSCAGKTQKIGSTFVVNAGSQGMWWELPHQLSKT